MWDPPESDGGEELQYRVRIYGGRTFYSSLPSERTVIATTNPWTTLDRLPARRITAIVKARNSAGFSRAWSNPVMLTGKSSYGGHNLSLSLCLHVWEMYNGCAYIYVHAYTHTHMYIQHIRVIMCNVGFSVWCWRLCDDYELTYENCCKFVGLLNQCVNTLCCYWVYLYIHPPSQCLAKNNCID